MNSRKLKVYLCDLTYDTIILVSDTIPINIGLIGAYLDHHLKDKVEISLFKYPNDVINGYTTMRNDEDPQSLNKPKIIFTEDKRMVYISRQAVPGFKDPKYSTKIYHKQVCIYAFNREELLEFGNFGRKSKLEESEDIEIIRFLEWGKNIRLVETQPGSLAVDEPEDVKKVEVILKKVWG